MTLFWKVLNTHAQLWIRIVFSTKERRPFLADPSQRGEMFRLLSHHVKENACVSVSVGGCVDHVHLLVGLSRTITLAKLVERVKTETSKWAKAALHAQGFSWQSGYGAFSVSHSIRPTVDRYIRNQSEHHRMMSFQDEYRRLCSKHGIEIDERYVWG